MKTKRILFLAVMGVLMLACAGCGKQKVYLNKYITGTESGYDGNGMVIYEFDKEAFVKDYSGKIKFNKKKNDNVSQYVIMSGESYEEALIDFCVDFDTEDTRYPVSNGDVINIEWSCKDIMAEDYFNCELVYSPIEYTVSELTPLKEFNPLDHVEVKFNGISGSATMEIIKDTTIPEMEDLWVGYDRSDYNLSYDEQLENIKNGDEIIIKADNNILVSFDEFAEKYGEKVSKEERTIVVEGLDEYVTDASMINDAAFKEMDDNLRKKFNEQVEEKWENKNAVQSMELVGNRVFSIVDKEDWPRGKSLVIFNEYTNHVYFIYKVSMLNADNEIFTYYWCGQYLTVSVATDGSCNYDPENIKVTEGDIFFGITSGNIIKCDEGHYVEGFTDLDSLSESEFKQYTQNLEGFFTDSSTTY